MTLLCGVPYTALPVATLISADTGTPMLIRRKEAKDYGTKKMIEGEIRDGDNCLIVEDVVTSGSSVLETANSLRSQGAVVTDAIVLLDRQQGGTEMLKDHGIRLKSVCNVTELMGVLARHGKIDQDTVDRVTEFVRNNQTYPKKKKEDETEKPASKMALEVRAAAPNINPLSSRLLRIMSEKKSNLCVALDVRRSAELLDLAEAVAPFVCAIKTHADSVADWTPSETEAKLTELARKHNFVLFEDRKLADIGATVAAQFEEGAGRWADLVTAHGVAGEGVLKGIQAGMAKDGPAKGVLIVSQMSCEGIVIVMIEYITFTGKFSCLNTS